MFLENKSGRLSEVSNILGNNGINMTAFSVADTSDFGLLRAIVSDPERAVVLLKEANFSASLTDVICIKCPNEPGALAKALDIMNAGNVQIEYMYAFSIGEVADVVIRPASLQNCINALEKRGMELVNANELYSL